MTTGEFARIGLVGCVKRKQDQISRASELYTSPLFVGRRNWVEATCDKWFILSALHGLVEPEEQLAPYDRTLKAATAKERRNWSEGVLESLRRFLGSLGDYEFEIHAGHEYVDYGLLAGLKGHGAKILRPAAGLGIGHQLALYALGPKSPG